MSWTTVSILRLLGTGRIHAWCLVKPLLLWVWYRKKWHHTISQQCLPKNMGLPVVFTRTHGVKGSIRVRFNQLEATLLLLQFRFERRNYTWISHRRKGWFLAKCGQGTSGVHPRVSYWDTTVDIINMRSKSSSRFGDKFGNLGSNKDCKYSVRRKSKKSVRPAYTYRWGCLFLCHIGLYYKYIINIPPP